LIFHLSGAAKGVRGKVAAAGPGFLAEADKWNINRRLVYDLARVDTTPQERVQRE